MEDTGFWICNNCDGYFTTDELTIKSVDMEDYYGVGGDFPDHNFENYYACPNCGSIDALESISEREYDDETGIEYEGDED